jgi:hypothetical protein
MVSVVKYFRRNQFQKKLFSRKYFLAFGSHEKITKRENAAVAGMDQWPGSVISGLIPAILARSGRLWPWPDSGQIMPESGRWHPATVAGCRRIPTPGWCWIPVPLGRPTIAGFGQSNIKGACNDKEYNF